MHVIFKVMNVVNSWGMEIERRRMSRQNSLDIQRSTQRKELDLDRGSRKRGKTWPIHIGLLETKKNNVFNCICLLVFLIVLSFPQ